MMFKTKILKSLAALFLFLLAGLSLHSCKDMLDVEPKDKLAKDKMYQDRYDADAAVIGVYGKFLGLAEQYVILNELRADLMDVTVNADDYLKEINEHRTSAKNPYADPRPFYEVILYCNDVLKNFDIMYEEHKLDETDYNQRYSDIGSLRSWLYLQLGIHYGSVPYITDPLENVNDIKDQSKFPMLNFDQLLDKLIEYMESLPSHSTYASDNTLVTTVDGYSTEKFFVNKKFLLGDLYLWKGDYLNAAINYKDIMTTADSFSEGDDFYGYYRIPWSNLTVEYVRYREEDYYALSDSETSGWRSMFSHTTDRYTNWEWIWVLPFDKNFQPENPFIRLFSNNGGDYLVKPSQTAMDYWNSQVQTNNFSYDARGRFTVKEQGGQPVIMKYLYEYDPLFPLDKQGKWYLNRVALLHLRFSEAANRDGRNKLAWALFNYGIKTTFDTDPDDPDQTYKQATFDVPPYDFDARMGDYPRYRDIWHRNTGIRGRAALKQVEVDTLVVTNAADSTIFIEEKLIEEAALELAYEGNRWGDLVRIARRNNDPSFLADKVYDKLMKDNNPRAEAVRSKLSDPANWYLPFEWEE